jgi:hypothetical protein
VLVAAGAGVGIATVTAIATGYEIRLTPEMIQLLTYKALGAASIGLILAGSWIGRGGTRNSRDPSIAKPERDALSEGPVATDLDVSASPKMKVSPDRANSADAGGQNQ